MFSFAKKLVDRLEGHADGSGPKDSYFRNCLEMNNKGYGLRVLKVVPHSVAHQRGFESWFDYVVAINGHELPMANPAISNYSYSINEDGLINYAAGVTHEQAGAIDYDSLSQELANLAKNNSFLTLDVWSAKGGKLRKIQIQLEEPIDEQADEKVTPLYEKLFKSIGLTLSVAHLSTATYVWRILKTHQGSPAFVSQLIPYSDYIIGCDSAFENDGDTGKGLLVAGGESLLSHVALSYYNHHFAQSQQEHIPITLYVYNHDYDILRPVTVNLSRSWGGGGNRGLLGCDVGYGLLHRIPEVVGKFDDGSFVDDVIFENNQSFSYDPSLKSTSNSPLPQPAVLTQSAQPIGQPPVGPPPAGPPPTTQNVPALGAPLAATPAARKKKRPTATAPTDLSEYMNEELAKSKQAETNYLLGSDSAVPPPPPKAK